MDFSIPQPLQETLKSVRKFLIDEVYPLERDLLSRPVPRVAPGAGTRSASESARWGSLRRRSAKSTAGPVSNSWSTRCLSEELGRTPLGHFVFNCQAPDAGNMEILQEFGTPEQKETWLKPLVAGKIRSCFSMTEPGYPGSNPVWMATTAVLDGDSYVINGRKWFTSSADGARFAIAMVVTDPNADPHARASQIIVPTRHAWFQNRPQHFRDGARRRGLAQPQRNLRMRTSACRGRTCWAGRGPDSRSRRRGSVRGGFIIACVGWESASARSICSASGPPVAIWHRATSWALGRRFRTGSPKAEPRSTPPA